MDKTEKFFVTDDYEADMLIEEYERNPDATLIDKKVSLKENKGMIYYIVTLKLRYKSLSEAKESV